MINVLAHLVTTGLGPVYDGVTHVLTSPDDLVPIVAAALLAGMNGAAAGRCALFVLPAAWLAGGAAGLLLGAGPVPGASATASFLVLGGLLAADRRLRPGTVGALAAAIGLLHGVLNGAGIAEAGREAAGLAGIVAAVFVLTALAAAPAVCARTGWKRVALRVIGSWVAAIGLLMLGWAQRAAV